MLQMGSITLFQIIVLVLVILAIVYFMRPKVETLVNFDKLQAYEENEPVSVPSIAPPSSDIFQEGAAVQQVSDEDLVNKVVVGEDTLRADELLPKYDEANEFAKENPVTELLKEQNYLISSMHAGINTVSQSSKIPYYDLRSLPAVPRNVEWPINNSSIDRSNAFQRRPLDIGN